VDGPDKRLARHVIPVREGSTVVWRDVRDHDTTTALGALSYRRVAGDQETFQVIGELTLEAGCGVTGQIAEAQCHLFEAKPLVDFIVQWLSAQFGAR
jgi:aminoglycoside 3-N-acetyltransferase